MLLLSPRELVDTLDVSPEVGFGQGHGGQCGVLGAKTVLLDDGASLVLRLDLGVLQFQRFGRGDAVEGGLLLFVLPVLLDGGPVAIGLEQQSVGALSDLEESVVSPGGSP